jgi:uncharacterized protein
MSTLASLASKGIAHPPRWLPNNTQYECIMGSVAYGVSSDTSDMDVYGIAIPQREDLFPHLKGEIPGFGRQHQRFEQYQEHHLQDPDALGGKGREYDVTIYSIVKFFQLAMENNPNIVDALFVPLNCVLYSTEVGNLIRENRRLFLHKGSWHKFKGYAYSQLHKIASKTAVGKRVEIIEAHGYDTKFAYHVVRLLLEAEMIMVEGDLDLQRHREQLKSIRRGEWTEQQIRDWASNKEAALEKVYHESSLRHSPDEGAIKAVLLQCLESHYGNLASCVVNPDAAVLALRKIQEVVEKVGKLL